MVIRQQVSDVIAYNKIQTTFTKAKETQKHVDKIITLGKKNTLAAKRAARAILLDTKDKNVDQLIDKIFNNLAKKYANRKGGYTRVLRIDNRAGDNTKMAIIELV